MSSVLCHTRDRTSSTQTPGMKKRLRWASIILPGLIVGIPVWLITHAQTQKAYLANARSEASILLELTNSYVSTYGQLRQTSANASGLKLKRLTFSQRQPKSATR